MLDMLSRFVIGWLLADHEVARLAQELIAITCERQNIVPDQLAIHADRGAALLAKPVAPLLADLGVTKSHSRPLTSNDNPYSEA